MTMDSYTLKTREWLNERFKKVDEQGVYIAHQPIYGFRRGACEPNVISRLSRTYQILRVLRDLPFTTFLDVGAAEGYFTALVRDLFGVQVTAFDLSKEAAMRAQEIYGLAVVAGDVHKLPFADNSFDVVYCSETTEHVEDPKKAIAELVRVAKKFVIVSTPYEARASSLSQTDKAEPHAHINTFDEHKICSLFPRPVKVRPLRFFPLLYFMVAAEAPKLPECVAKRYNFLIRAVYRLWQPLAKRLFGFPSARWLVEKDAKLIARHPARHCDLLAVYEKTLDEEAKRDCSDNKILDFIFNCHLRPARPLIFYQRTKSLPEYKLTNLVCPQCDRELKGDNRGYVCGWCHQRRNGEDRVVDFGL